MKILSVIAGLLSSNARAADLNMDYGDMYHRICDVLPFCGSGAEFFAKIGWAAINLTLPLTGFAAIASIAVAAIKLITGGEEGMSEAKKIVTTTIIGTFLALGAYGIMVYLNNQVVQDTIH